MKAGRDGCEQETNSGGFSSLREKILYISPFKITQTEERFVVSVLVRGGGKNGQIDAVVHGLALL